jgi:hyperosmotically inducible protein
MRKDMREATPCIGLPIAVSHGGGNTMQTSRSMFVLSTTTLMVLALPLGLGAADQAKTSSHMDPYVAGQANETALIKEVRHNLLMLPYYGVFDDLGFNVDGSTVTLTGQVNDPTLKNDAGNAVKKIKDVTNVVNNIEVLPLSPADNTIRLGAYRAIYNDPTLSVRYAYRATPPIHIIVKNGHIRLEGVVSSQADKDIIGVRVNGVPGAFAVENDLQVSK